MIEFCDIAINIKEKHCAGEFQLLLCLSYKKRESREIKFSFLFNSTSTVLTSMQVSIEK